MSKKKLTMIGLSVLLILLSIFFSIRILGIDVPLVEFSRELEPSKISYSYSIGTVWGKQPLRLYEKQQTKNPVLDAGDIDDVDALFVADPFMIHENNSWYMFFEVFNKQSGQGDIGLAKSADGIDWEYQKIVLDEAFHLSYPHVFVADEQYYMIPETNVVNEIRLYKSTDFPFSWHHDSTLIRGRPFADSTILKYKDHWWIFTTTDPQGMSTLRLYHAKELRGPWSEHPSSPIIQGDANIARPAGKILVYKNVLFRVSQDDWPTYGNRVRIFQIDTLTRTDYDEHELEGMPLIEVEGAEETSATPAWRADGFHQLDLHQVGENQWFGCIDGVVLNRTEAASQWVFKIRVPFTRRVEK